MTRHDDVEQFERFVAARLGALLRFAAAMAHDRRAAEDLVQTALASTWAAWPRVRRRDDPEAYVRRVITNAYIAQWRRARRFAALPWQRLETVVDPPADRDDALWSALQTLPPRQRAVVILRFCEDRSESETASLLGCTVGTVKSQAAKGLARLRLALAVETADEAS